MNEAMRKMKKYTNSVERRLNLPRDVRARVMSDFVSSISARREQGMTDEEIYSELGTAREAAQAINEQMKEFTYKKSPWRFLFLAAAIYGGYQLLMTILSSILLWFFMAQTSGMGDHASIGIIGGADGPTAVFVTSSVSAGSWLWLLALLAGAVGYLRLCRCKK